MKDPTYTEARIALECYVPKDQTGTPYGRRVQAMRDAIREFLKMRGELTESDDEASK